MSEKIKVYFILPTLFAGGAERVISFVSQNIDQKKFTVKLIIIGFEKDSKFKVENIQVLYLNKNRVLKAIFGISKILLFDKPNIVMSSIGHLNALMGIISQFFPKIKFIGRVAAISKVSSKYNSDKSKSIFHRIDGISSYGITKLEYIICQSTDMKNDFLEGYNYEENRVKIIHNPITQSYIKKRKDIYNQKAKRFFTVGRLTEIKGHIRILGILSKLNFPFIYTIVGDGPLKEKIFERANLLGISKQIKHISYSDNVSNFILNNDIFLQGSYSEGFPNALLESCAAGTPVIAFNVPGGTKEIVEDGVNGFLVDTEEEFIERLKDTREWDPEIIRESVYRKFNKEKILSQYEDLFISILK